MAIFDDLENEEARLQDILERLDDSQWATESGAPGWSVADVVLHLAQSEEGVVASVTGVGIDARHETGVSVDEQMARLVESQRDTPQRIFQRWRTARVAALAELRGADPAKQLRWIEAPLKPATLATTRLAEHWAHALDITRPLGIDLPDTDRLRHIAWLAHRSLAYAFALAGQPDQQVYCRLTAPGGETWEYGPQGAASSITGSAGAFCRVAAQRLAPDQSGLRGEGPHGAAALNVLRTYAA
ncbi:MAG TPA: maleylpyruvate isomerase family mycothiol-dependent enzyme [Streptosporangiaceae bacterium]|nr:maleylpyruvate isomerase family mycothiol-dependent enzyme [Streptosporangiaceae bacterium]